MKNDNLKNEQQCTIHDVSGSVLITTTKRELGKYEFFCEKCKRLHMMSAYAVAQLTMGHELIFSCPCGEKITLEPF